MIFHFYRRRRNNVIRVDQRPTTIIQDRPQSKGQSALGVFQLLITLCSVIVTGAVAYYVSNTTGEIEDRKYMLNIEMHESAKRLKMLELSIDALLSNDFGKMDKMLKILGTFDEELEEQFSGILLKDPDLPEPLKRDADKVVKKAEEETAARGETGGPPPVTEPVSKIDIFFFEQNENAEELARRVKKNIEGGGFSGKIEVKKGREYWFAKKPSNSVFQIRYDKWNKAEKKYAEELARKLNLNMKNVHFTVLGQTAKPTFYYLSIMIFLVP